VDSQGFSPEHRHKSVLQFGKKVINIGEW